MLTNAEVKAARPRAAAYKIFDERGLHLYVATNGRKSLRMKFQFEGREKLLTIGTWPEVSLVDARARCDLAHEQLRPRRGSIEQVGRGSGRANLHVRGHRQTLPRAHALALDAGARDRRPREPRTRCLFSDRHDCDARRADRPMHDRGAGPARDGEARPATDLWRFHVRDRRRPGAAGSRGDARPRVIPWVRTGFCRMLPQLPKSEDL